MLTDLLDSYKLHFKSREPTRMFTNKNGQTSIRKLIILSPTFHKIPILK